MNSSQENSSTIQTGEFRLGSTIHAREKVYHWSGKFWFIVSAPIVALGCYGIWIDWRFMVITASLVFILFPTFALAAYNMILTSQSAIRSMFPQRVTLKPDGSLLVKYSALQPTDRVPGHQAPPDLMVPSEKIDWIRYWNRHTVVGYGGNRTLIVPDKSFRNTGEAREFYQRLEARNLKAGV